MLRLDRTPPRAPARQQLDPDQERVAAHRRGPLLVLAGPGTGKTSTIMAAICGQLTGLPRGSGAVLTSDRVLGLTFGRKAARELRDRVATQLAATEGYGGGVPVITTFHSFCYSLVREHSCGEAFLHPPRLLSGPEQDSRLRDLLTHAVREGRVPWPAELDPAIGTWGLSAQVRAVIARARALGLDPGDLARIGVRDRNSAWESVGRFLDEYLNVLDAEGVLDYTELVHRAVLLAESGEAGPALRNRYQAIYVDEYQDTDPSQVRLLRALAGPESALVVVGDPDQAIYGFRGADVGGILRFGDEFATPAFPRVPVVVLRTTRRFGPVIRDVAKTALRRVPLPGLAAGVQQLHREPRCAPEAGRGRALVLTFESEGAHAEHIADLLRRARLGSPPPGADGAGHPGLAWSDMAVIVRSATRDAPLLSRVLTAAGVPVEVAADEIPLRHDPAVRPLLAALRAATDPDAITPESALMLITSPLCGLGASEVRRFGRALRAADREAGRHPRPSAFGLRDALAEPALAAGFETSAARRVADLGILLRRASAAISAKVPVTEVLWLLWDGTSWPRRLEHAARGSGEAASWANRDLDSVLALFSLATRDDDRYDGQRGVANFIAELQNQAIPAETLAETGTRRDAVRVLTAHRAKGLQWRLVLVAGVQEGTWPDLRRRDGLLASDRLGRDELRPALTTSELLTEERRLFYVACTRAREQLIITAVATPDDAGPQPSRFVTAAAAAPGARSLHVPGRPRTPFTMRGVVVALRRAVTDPRASPGLRAAASRRLAALASQLDEQGSPLVPAADPASWWATRDRTECEVPVRDPVRPLDLSGTALTGIGECPLRWFLGRQARAEESRSTALGFGSLVHALADAVARSEVAPDLRSLLERLDAVWPDVGYEAKWQADGEYRAAEQALDRFLHWHTGRPDRELVATEVPFEVEMPVAQDTVRLRGAIDRVELAEDGVHVIDLKTMRKAPTAAEVEGHPQLALYQQAVRAGAADEALGVLSSAPLPSGPGAGADRPPVAGAELVQLRVSARGGTGPKVQAQEPFDPARFDSIVGSALETVRTESFSATPASSCGYCSFKLICPAQPEGRDVTRGAR